MAIYVQDSPLNQVGAVFEKSAGILIHASIVGPLTPTFELPPSPPTPGRKRPNPNTWNPNSWLEKPVQHSVTYADPEKLEWTCTLLSRLPALVDPADIELARKAFQEVALGKSFIIQGGDCAESFDDVSPESVAGHVSLLAKQAAILSKAMGGKPVLEIGRIAGQYAKPRSSPQETLPTGETVLTFRGENVNSPDPKNRIPDAGRLVMGYVHASKRLQSINHARKSGNRPDGSRDQFYTSHEALHLPLESALTQGCYNTSAAFLWIGARTAHPDGAHVEYMRGLRNPIGIKIGPTAKPDTVVKMLDILCPDKKASWGRVTLITRLGAGRAPDTLPALIRAVQSSGHMPVWMCDPCHGNTENTTEGYKTRRLQTMLHELQETFMVHCDMGTHLGGIHLEQTGEMVTECIDSTRVKSSCQLQTSYQTLCDPRLAKDQALLLVQQFADFVKQHSSMD